MIKSVCFTNVLLTDIRHLSLITFLFVVFCIECGCLSLLVSLDWSLFLLIAVQGKGCKFAMVWVQDSLTDLTSMQLRGRFLRRHAIRFETVTTAVGSKVRQIIAVLYMEVTLPNHWMLIHNFIIVVAIYEVWIVKNSLLSWLVEDCNATYAIFKFWNLLLMIEAHLQASRKFYMVRKVTRCFCGFVVKSVESSTANHFNHLLHLMWRLVFTLVLNCRRSMARDLCCRNFALILVKVHKDCGIS